MGLLSIGKCGFELIYEGDGLYQGSKRKITKTIKFLKATINFKIRMYNFFKIRMYIL